MLGNKNMFINNHHLNDNNEKCPIPNKRNVNR